MRRKLSKSLWLDRAGNAATEFAFVAPVLILITLCILDFGRLLLIRSTMHYAVEEAGRYAMVYKTATKTAIETYAKSRVPFVDPTSLSITATIDSPSAGYVTITSDYTFSFIVDGLLPSGTATIPMHAQAIVPRVS